MMFAITFDVPDVYSRYIFSLIKFSNEVPILEAKKGGAPTGIIFGYDLVNATPFQKRNIQGHNLISIYSKITIKQNLIRKQVGEHLHPTFPKT